MNRICFSTLMLFYLEWVLGNCPVYGTPVNPILPGGFSVSLIADSLTSPTDLEFSPDGRLFVSTKAGQLRVIKNGVLLEQSFLTVDPDTAGEHGLMGVAFDPSFETNSYVYVYYVAKIPSIHARVSRFTAQGDTVVDGSEKVVIDLDDRGTSMYHVSGSIHFGPDGKLYISSGDNAGVPYSDNAQRLTNSLGKILRINSDGTFPQDNPFNYSATGMGRSIWAYGFRNPFTFSIQPGTGKIMANDVGQAAWEEIDDVVAGGNYGWPLAEGASKDVRFKSPVYAYAHGDFGDDVKGCAITGGVFYNPVVPQFPTEYTGKYFFTDYCNNWIHVYDPVTGVESSFGQNMTSNPVNMTVGPDGAVYYTSEWFNSVYKLSYDQTQSLKIISQPSDQLVGVGLSATFTVSVLGSLPMTFQWQKNGVDIANANASSYSTPLAALSDNGALFTCKITNSAGAVTSLAATLKVVNDQPPSICINFPTGEALYNAGDTVYYSGSAYDHQDGDLPPSAYTWEVRLQHDSHFHPFVPSTSGVSAGSFQIPTTGESSSNIWYRIILTIKNASGLTTTAIRDVYLNHSTFSLTTSPPGLKVLLDGQPVTSPADIIGNVGFMRTVAPLPSQVVNGVTYVFDSWSDGQPAAHTFRTSVKHRTYTAVYKPSTSTRSGSISASPNPALVCDGSGAGITTLSWTSMGTTVVEVHINAPQGDLLIPSEGSSGSFTTPKWIGDGSTFYLQDVSGGLPLTVDNTLATVTVNLSSYACDALKNGKK